MAVIAPLTGVLPAVRGGGGRKDPLGRFTPGPARSWVAWAALLRLRVTMGPEGVEGGVFLVREALSRGGHAEAQLRPSFERKLRVCDGNWKSGVLDVAADAAGIGVFLEASAPEFEDG